MSMNSTIAANPQLLSSVLEASKRAFELQGERAFEMPMSAAAWHETGHAILHAVANRRVIFVRITRNYVKAKSYWSGFTRVENWAPRAAEDTPVDADLEYSRCVAAGLVSERLHERDQFRAASSLDEEAQFRAIVKGAASKLGGDPEELISQQIEEVIAILRRNERQCQRIADALIEHRILQRDRLEKLLERVR